MKGYKIFLLGLTNKELQVLDTQLHEMKIKRGIQREAALDYAREILDRR